MREDAFEIAYAGGEILHFAETFMHLLQPLADEAERFAEARFKRGLQLLVHGLAHLFELRRVIGLKREQALIYYSANGFELLPCFCTRAGELLRDAAGESLNAGRDLFAQRPAFVALTLLRACKIVAQAGFEGIV